MWCLLLGEIKIPTKAKYFMNKWFLLKNLCWQKAVYPWLYFWLWIWSLVSLKTHWLNKNSVIIIKRFKINKLLHDNTKKVQFLESIKDLIFWSMFFSFVWFTLSFRWPQKNLTGYSVFPIFPIKLTGNLLS